jgi:hypothetical protein
MGNTLRVPTAQVTLNRQIPSRDERAAFFQRRDRWLKWLTVELATEQSRQFACKADVSPNTALALAEVIGDSGESFAQGGIYAKQETLAAGLAKRLVRAKATVRLVRRGLNLLVKTEALRIETRSGRTNLLVPLLAGSRLYDGRETKSEARTVASATPDANIRTTPDATVREPRTPASCESFYLNLHIENLHSDTPPYPPVGGGGGEVSTVDATWDDTVNRQQAAPHKGNGHPNGNEPESSGQAVSPERATEQIFEGEILLTEGAPAFEHFWKACAEPRGPLGFAQAEWRKLSPDEQRRACERPSRNGTWAGSWLRGRIFDLPPNIVERRHTSNPFAALAYESMLEERAAQDGDDGWRESSANRSDHYH